jgi:hypothetical protein
MWGISDAVDNHLGPLAIDVPLRYRGPDNG